MKRIQHLSAHVLPNAEQATEHLSASACSANPPKKVWYAPYKFEAYGEEEIAAVTSALRDGWLAPGPRTEEFERRVCQLFGKAHGIMVNSGSSGNIIGLAALGLEKGDEVITPACTFATVIAPLEQLGFRALVTRL
ncbi:UDP-4-amino-4-deoxy-L-arabinose--oxoglutarate aminotransferase [Symbiodinium microadriaticum]|uniref:UDP-4-amino-4-deoxy-L-arabinose--oxoglutarate aminotransferase n=1 Tax=Symbiodinium microadriaticum TaxID=2951 RepID=A0A1Q9CX56_SYMMI|nr:UDP-4-amino-4-deoxy-L-arabinose--oxoglutarate aminotransferase [Symbiodinium microadriaticum]